MGVSGWFSGAIVALLAAVLVLQLVVLRRLSREGRAPVGMRLDMVLRGQELLQRGVREELAAGRAESARSSLDLRQEVSGAVERMGAALREDVGNRLSEIRTDNDRRLEEIRTTVDRKLQETLEARLGESFRQVSERLERVHQGLGEMHSLAAGVGDLKRVLTNVKARGTWGEVQLGSLLEQVLTPDQYQANVVTRCEGNERVEYAVLLPGREDGGQGVWLPIDAKFPLEDHQRLLEAQERCDSQMAEAAGRALEARVKAAARDIKDKYLDPPRTTDFGIMFLPTEGLYAEILRRPGLVDGVQREHRILITGPTTLAALLNSLQMGFRTLAIEQRSGEVWELLGAVRAQFGQFGDVLVKVQKRLQSASESIDNATRKSRRIERSLRAVEQAPPDAVGLQLIDAGPAITPDLGDEGVDIHEVDLVE